MEIGAIGRASADAGYAPQWKNMLQNVPQAAQREGGALPEDVIGQMPPVAEKGKGSGVSGRTEDGECQTCASRTYQDGSNDPGVSFKTATKVDPDAAAGAVRGHEMEHVMREQFKAEQANRRVVSQSVVMHTAICPECGSSYVSGGTTRTVTKGADVSKQYQTQMPQDETGKNLSVEV